VFSFDHTGEPYQECDPQVSPVNVLVTGGTGFIGGHVVRGLTKQSHKGVALDSIPDTDWLKDVADRITIVRGDVQDLATVVGTIKKFQITHVVHTASLLTVSSQERPWIALNVNVVGTVNILEASRIMDVAQIAFASSTAVYGDTEEGKVIDEDHPLRPVTIYGATKLVCEHYGLTYSKDHGIGFIALRFPIVYGPGQSRRGFSSVKEVVEKPLLGMPANVPVGGDQQYDIVYVKDVADAMISACFARKTAYRAFNIGIGTTHSLKDVANIVSRIVPGAVFDIGPGLDIAEPVRGPLDITRARKELGYEPKFSLEKGIIDYIQTLKNAGRVKSDLPLKNLG